MPSFLQADLRHDQDHHEDRKSIRKLNDIAIRLCDICADMKDSPCITQDMLLSNLLELDAGLSTWADYFSSDGTYSIITALAKCDDIYEGSYHVYRDFWNAAILTNYRCLRITLNELIMECLTALRSSSKALSAVLLDELHDRSCATMLEVSRDICSSVPFFLGYTAKQHSQTGVPPQAMGGLAYELALIYPLLFAARIPRICDVRRQWIIKRLEKIGHKMGIHLALRWASQLRRPYDPVTEWSAGLGDG